MSKNRTIAKNSAFLYIKLLVTSAIGIVFSRLILQALGVSDYGLFNVVAGFVTMLNVSNLFLIGATYRFISYELGKGNPEDVNKIFNVSLSMHLGMALIVLLIAETIGRFYILHYLNVDDGRLTDALFVFHVSVIMALFSIISIPYQGLMTAYEEFGTRSLIDVLQIVLKLFIAVALMRYQGERLRLYSIFMLALAMGCSVLYFVCCKLRHSEIIRWRPFLNKAKYAEMLAFSGWSSIGAIVCLGRVQGNSLIINFFFGTVLNASFGIANQVNQILLMCSQGISQAVVPQIIQSYSGGDNERATKLVCYVNKYSFLLMLLPSIPLLLEMDYLLKIWLIEPPVYTLIFCKLMVINALLDCLASSGIPAYVQATGKIKIYQIINGTAQLLVLPLSFLLLKIGYPAPIIFWVQITITISVIPLRLVLIKQLYDFDIKSLIQISTVKCVMISISVLPLFLLKPLLGQSYLQLILMTCISVTYYSIIVYFVGLGTEEKSKVKSTFSVLYIKASNVIR